MPPDEVTLIAGLRPFLDDYAAEHRRAIEVSPAPGLMIFLNEARPLLRQQQASTVKADALPPPSLSRLETMLRTLHRPLRQARSQGELLQAWSIASLKRNEVRNAAVLAWLLNPRGSHGCGPVILQNFLECAATVAPEWPALGSDLTSVQVYTEERPLGSDRDRVDVAIDGPDFCLFVEVKIDASEGKD